MKHFSEAKEIWQKFVPKSGQADTVQGEMLRAVEKLRDEARRNGNRNWDRGFEIFLTYLSEKLSDSNAFDVSTREQTQSILHRLQNFQDPYLQDDFYDELGDRVVEYYKHYGSQLHQKNSSLKR